MVEVVVTDDFRRWYEGLTAEQQQPVAHAVGVLEQEGVALAHPLSSSILGSRYAIRELRIQARGRPFRVFYAFDPKRQAVLLLGGDKTGRRRFYDEMVPRAEALWERYLKAVARR